MASSKNYTEVLIGGKVFSLSGFESEDYLQKVKSRNVQAAMDIASRVRKPEVCFLL